MAILSKLIYRINAKQSLTKSQEAFFFFLVEIESDPKFMWKCKETRIAKTVLKNKKHFGRLSHLISGWYYEAIVIITIWFQHKDRHTDQCNKIGSHN